eukprot:305851-Rhodomonas_salina.1
MTLLIDPSKIHWLRQRTPLAAAVGVTPVHVHPSERHAGMLHCHINVVGTKPLRVVGESGVCVLAAWGVCSPAPVTLTA